MHNSCNIGSLGDLSIELFCARFNNLYIPELSVSGCIGTYKEIFYLHTIKPLCWKPSSDGQLKDHTAHDCKLLICACCVESIPGVIK